MIILERERDKQTVTYSCCLQTAAATYHLYTSSCALWPSRVAPFQKCRNSSLFSWTDCAIIIPDHQLEVSNAKYHNKPIPHHLLLHRLRRHRGDMAHMAKNPNWRTAAVEQCPIELYESFNGSKGEETIRSELYLQS